MGKNKDKMMNAWQRNFRSSLVFMEKKIKDIKRERPGEKFLEKS